MTTRLRQGPLRWLALLAVAAAALWLGGLGWFIASSLIPPAEPATPTDAAVVLTGGKLRLEAGLALLTDGKAKKLFISGVNPQVDREALLRALGPPAAHEACCIVLGHEADNTYGNARETAHWMGAEGYRSLRLVTSWYHMPRSMLEFRRAMPRLAILPHPVFARQLEAEHWWGRHYAVVVLGEYLKFLAAWVRPALNAMFPPPSPLTPVLRTAAISYETAG